MADCTRDLRPCERLQLPWDYSEAPKPHEPTVENRPTPEGIALGHELARLCDIEEAKQREQFPNQQPRCSDCAARAGTLPNGCEETLMDLIKCSVEGVPFYCHKGMRNGEPRRLCVGWMILQAASPVAEEQVASNA